MDSIDGLLADWARVVPGEDFTPVGVVARLARVRAHVDAELEAVFARHGLTGPNFAVLVTLRRLDEPAGVSQRTLMRELHLTSGTVSLRIDRLVEQQLVERHTDPTDRRNSRITLTARGRQLFEAAVPEHLATERRLLTALDADQRELLAGLLRELLLSYEGSAVTAGEPGWLGLILAPAVATGVLRRSVGLPDVVGLLVRAVDPTGPAAQAGLAVGDVLTSVDGHELRSITPLLAAARQPGAQSLTLETVRGTQTRTVTVDLGPAVPGGFGARCTERPVHIL